VLVVTTILVLGAATLPAAATAPDTSNPQISVTVTRTAGGDALAYTVTVTNLEAAGRLWVDTPVPTTAASGVTQPADGRYRWDGTATTVRLTVVPPPSTVEAATDTWALGTTPRLTVGWQSPSGGAVFRVTPFEHPDAPHVDLRTQGPGIVGTDFAFLGPATVHTRATVDGTVELVVPAGVTPTADPRAVLDVVERAATRLGDGAGPVDARVFVVPEDGDARGGTYLSSDESWITASARLDTADNTWLHEYLHTRQRFDLGPRMRWFREASAEYLAARLATDLDLVSTTALQTYLLRQSGPPSRLTDPGTWPDDGTPYDRGARVLAALDRQIRDRTEGRHSLATVFRRLNAYDGTVTYPVFVTTVTDVAGADLGPWLDHHVAGATPVRTAPPATLLDGAGLPAIGLLVVLSGIFLQPRPRRR